MSRIAGAGKTDIHLLDPSQIEIITDESHVLYDERLKLPVSEALVLSIMAIGVKVPILARKNGESVIVVDGRQRVRAAVEANRRLKDLGRDPVRIPTKMERASDQDLYSTMVATNEIRQADSPLVVARKIQKALDMGRTEQEAAITFGRPVSAIRQLLALLDCAPAVQKAVSAGTLPVSSAAKLAKLSKEEQAEALAEAKDGGVREVTKAVRKKQGRKTTDIPSKKELKALMHSLESCQTKDDNAHLIMETLRFVVLGEMSLRLGNALSGAVEKAA